MARLWWDGFEYGWYNGFTVMQFLYPNSSLNYSTTYGATPMTTPVYTGSYSFRITTSTYYPTNYLCLTLGAAKSELYIKVNLRPDSVSKTEPLIGLYKGTTCLAWLRQVNRNLELYSGTGTGTQLGSTAVNALSANGADWNLVELRLKVANSPDGYAQVRVSETLVIDASGVDTQPGADADMDMIRIGASGGASLSGDAWYIDDFIVDDANWVGNKRVYKVQITGVGATGAVWDAEPAGTNWSRIDEIPYSNTDYIYTNTTDECDTYGCSNLPGTATSAKGLMVIIRAAEEGTATPQNVQIACLTEATLYYSDSYAPPSGSAGFYKYLWATNPETAADWTVAEINAVELGVKAVA